MTKLSLLILTNLATPKVLAKLELLLYKSDKLCIEFVLRSHNKVWQISHLYLIRSKAADMLKLLHNKLSLAAYNLNGYFL